MAAYQQQQQLASVQSSLQQQQLQQLLQQQQALQAALQEQQAQPTQGVLSPGSSFASGTVLCSETLFDKLDRLQHKADLTLSQTRNFRLFQIERVCRRQLHI